MPMDVQLILVQLLPNLPPLSQQVALKRLFLALVETMVVLTYLSLEGLLLMLIAGIMALLPKIYLLSLPVTTPL